MSFVKANIAFVKANIAFLQLPGHRERGNLCMNFLERSQFNQNDTNDFLSLYSDPPLI